MAQNDSIQEFSSKVIRAVRDSKAVVVICSEVLATAFGGTARTDRKQAQMKFGKFGVSKVSKIMMKSAEKFVPVTLTGANSICPELQKKRCFDLKNHGEFMSSARASLNRADVQSDPQFSELVLTLQLCECARRNMRMRNACASRVCQRSQRTCVRP